MANAEQLYGRLSIFFGLLAVGVAGGFAYFVPTLNLEFAFEGVDLFGKVWTLPSFVLVALLFQFGTPLFCMAAFFFGTRASKYWTGKVGMALAVLSLVAYVIYIRSCARLFSM